jgi:periplasmic protein TonB
MTTLQTVRPVRLARRLSPTSLAIVAALHIVIIYGIYEGLLNHWSMPVVTRPITEVPIPVPKHTTDQPPISNPASTFTTPKGPTVKPPIIDIDNGNKEGTITGPTGGGGIIHLPPVEIAAQGILSTHTIPAYPPIAVRLNQTGNVKLRLTIDEHGVVTVASVEKSSGYDSLDNAAVAWVIAHWRYRPATKDGAPIASVADALVTFRLTGG